MFKEEIFKNYFVFRFWLELLACYNDDYYFLLFNYFMTATSLWWFLLLFFYVCCMPSLAVEDFQAGGDLGIAQLNSWPVLFHPTHTSNIRLSHERRRARRFEGLKGVCFSSRPICNGERVYIKIIDTSTTRDRGLHFGFTADDPYKINVDELSRYVCLFVILEYSSLFDPNWTWIFKRQWALSCILFFTSNF